MEDRDHFDTQEKEELFFPLVTRKHSNDPNNLVSTKLLHKLGGDEVPEVENDDQQQIVFEEEQDENEDQESFTLNEGSQTDDLRDRNFERSRASPTPRRWSLASGEEDMLEKEKEKSIQSNGNDEQSIDFPPMKEDQVHRNRDRTNSSNSTERNKIESSNYGNCSWFRVCSDFINQVRYQCGMFVNNQYVQLLIIVMIAINAIMLGLGTFDFIKGNPQLQNAFEMTDYVFLIVFTIELGFQFIYHGWRLLLDGWLIFDLVIIVTSWSFASVQIIRAFRIFRSLRLVTRVKILKHLILALFGVMPRMAAIGLMLCLIFYIFGVMMTQLFRDLYVEGHTDYNYFGSLDWTFFTLFQMMTLDDWASISRQVTYVYKWAWIPFVAFVIISGFIIANLIIAVICDAIGALQSDARAKLHGDFDDGNSDTRSDNCRSMDILEQLDTLEDRMEDLTRIQARTFHMLQYLTQQVQMHKIRQEIQSKSIDFALMAKKLKRVMPKKSERQHEDNEDDDEDGTIMTARKQAPESLSLQ